MKKHKKRILRKERGITLIALVITIIVLLILAGVSIAMLTGENGILTQAQEAKNKTTQAEQEETEDLGATEDLINQYVKIDWDSALENATKHPDQVISTAIGVGTDGKPVNMDLWEYNYDDTTGGYGLNDSKSLTTTASADASKGYTGTDFNNIVIPQYISTDEGESWTAVTNLDWLFYNCTELEKINKLPDTAKSMRYTFRGCTNIKEISKLPSRLENMMGTFHQSGISKVPTIPQSVNNMYGTFNGCSSLTFPPKLPEGLINLSYTFYNCTSLKNTPDIPNSVEIMESTFEGCIGLETATPIPSTVTNMIHTFTGCTSLRGNLEINANLTGKTLVASDGNEKVDYFRILDNATEEGLTLKLSGSCKILNEIITQTNNPRITL